MVHSFYNDSQVTHCLVDVGACHVCLQTAGDQQWRGEDTQGQFGLKCWEKAPMTDSSGINRKHR